MIQGETLQLAITIENTSEVVFRFGGAESKSITATKAGNLFSISTSTIGWASGSYAWQAWATSTDGVVCVAQSGSFQLDSELCVGDVRSSARKMVEMIEAMMAGNASEGVRRYKINNRELERYSVDELLKLLSFWKSRQLKEDRVQAGRSILGNRISVRF
jgi:hypothetical protein